ncbi:MAG: hypothetical protein M1823_000211 [Watsoniomyces obsoletus]|nr:MAG: hypothetical protein M1823_000211 [Watsoniomyces obsoletus]
MATASYQTPDLATVLQTLAQYNSPAVVSSNSIQPSSTKPVNEDEDEYEPPETVEPPQPIAQSSRPQFSPTPPVASTSTSVLPRKIDPATITDWPGALRCVMRTVAVHDASIARIKKMIKVQHEHERQWWEGRQALLKKHEARIDGRKKLDDVLRAVGGQPSLGSSQADTEADASELKLYDRKVHIASTEMVKAMQAELRELGVPFFGVRSHLVIVEKTNLGKRSRNSVGGDGDGDEKAGSKGVIEQQQLIELQRKMLQLLQDMCTS